MSDLRLVGRSSDGTELELQSSDGTNHSLRISDHLRSLVNQPRLVSVASIDEETVVTVKELQARLRSGESIESLARTTSWTPEKIEKYSGPILQERAYIIGLALESQLRREKHSPTLAAATISQLSPRGVDMALVEWNTWRAHDGIWNIILSYPIRDGALSHGNWSFDANNRSLEALDDTAAWISGDELESKPQNPSHGIVYPSSTPPPRLVAVRENEEPSISHHPTLADAQVIADREDGVTRRLKIPSWDDIMFGGPKETSTEE